MKIFNLYKLKFLFTITFIFYSCSEEISDITEVILINPPMHFQISEISQDGKLLSWTDNSNSEDGYIIERSINYQVSYEKLAILPANSDSFFDSTVIKTSPKTIYYKLYAVKGDLKSLPVTLVYQREDLLSPTNLSFEELPDKSLKLSWIDNSIYETSYIVEKRLDNDKFIQISELPPNTTSFIDTNIDTNSIHEYRVAGLMHATISGYSNILRLKYIFNVIDIKSIDDSYGTHKIFFIPNTNHILLVFNNDNWITDRSIKIVQKDGTIVRSLPDSSPMVSVSSSGKIMASTGQNSDINIWDIETWTLRKTIKRNEPRRLVTHIDISPDDEFVAIYEPEGTVEVYNISDETMQWRRDDIIGGYPNVFNFNSLGNHLIVSLDFYNTTNGDFIKKMTYPGYRQAFINQSRKYMLINATFDYLINLESSKREVVSYLNENELFGTPSFIEQEDGTVNINFSSFLESYYREIWKITIQPNSTPTFSADFANIVLYPDRNYALGFGANSKVRILKLGKKWVPFSESD